jgi:probable HAF family extracellular repeat protein
MSPNGTTIPAASQINDGFSNWTLSKGVAYQNGQPTASSSVVELLLLNGVIYQDNVHKNWYAWRNSAWVSTSPPIVPSANGTAIPGAMQIIDNELNIWTISAGRVYENQAPTPSSSVTRVFFSNGIVYQENVHDNWYLWSGSAWSASSVPPGATPSQYTLTDLGTLGGKSSSAAGINASGQITGGSTLPGDQVTHVFTYANGVMKDIGTPDGSTYAVGSGINASGQLSVNTQARAPWRYSNGVWTNLNPADPAQDQYGSAQAINDSGHVTGDTDGNGFFYDGTLHFFPTAIEQIGTGNGINNSDVITGGQTVEPGNREIGFVYNPHTGSITTFIGFDGGFQSEGDAINASGYVAGWADYGSIPVDPSTSSEGPPHAFLNDAAGEHDLGTLGGSSSFGDAINANSQVVGSSDLAGDAVTHAFLYSGGVMMDVNSLVSSSALAPYVTLNEATGINDSGWIIANGVDSRTGETHGYLLKPAAAP